MKKNLLLLLFNLFTVILVKAQSVETFETESIGSTTFTDNGKTFNITSLSSSIFRINSETGAGWNGYNSDNQFIDNYGTYTPNETISFKISSADGSTFGLRGIYLYLSTVDYDLNVLGSLNIEGYRNGNRKYSNSREGSFARNPITNNGYIYFDFSNISGYNLSDIFIDEFIITTSGSIEYIALDAMNWVKCSNISVSAQSLTNVACHGATTGSISVLAAGGKAPYSYSWSPSGGTASTASNLAAGTYTVTVTDDNGCYGSQSFSITQPNTLNVTPSQTNVSCNGATNGTATVNVTGGSGPYTYSWAPTGGTAATANGLSAGTYTVTITDANGCEKTQSFIITQPNTLNVTASQTNVSCNGGANGTATVNVTGGSAPYTYSWAPTGGTAATATGLAVGTYTVTITDANACQATRSFTINQPSVLNATISKTDVSCNGESDGTATANVTGGTAPYTYYWYPYGGTTATATGLAAGSYTLFISDANGCQVTKNVVIMQPSALNVTASQTNVSCFGETNGTATVIVTGGSAPYTYSWAPTGGTAATANGLSAGTYTVTITDANGCEKTQSFIITQPNTLNVTPSQTDVSCNGGANGTATVNVTGGSAPYTYSWAPTGGTAATATGLSAGTYTVTITDAIGCETTKSFTITQPPLLQVNTNFQNNITCYGESNGSAMVNATGGTGSYSYSWSPTGATSASVVGLSAGSHYVTVTDDNGCQATRILTFTQPPALVANPVMMGNVSCNGGSNGFAIVNATGGSGSYSYAWTPSGATTATATGLSATAHKVTVTDINGCKATHTFLITQPATQLTATAAGQVNVTEYGAANGQAMVSATGGVLPYTYNWAPTGGNAATASGLAAGTYTVTVTDAYGCEVTQSFTITQPAAPLQASVSAQTNVSCNGGSNGSATVTASGGTAPYTYSWSPTGGTGATANGLSAGMYIVTITDANQVSRTVNVFIYQPTTLVANSGSITHVYAYGAATGSATVVASGGIPPYTYSWTGSSSTTATASNLAAGTYAVTVTDANGCTTSQSFTITQPSSALEAFHQRTN